MSTNVRESLLEALRHLSRDRDPITLTHAELAKAAGVALAAARRELGPVANFPALVSYSAPKEEVTDTRQRILEAAARVFARKGYQGSTLDEVASDAGLTKGAIYWHFKNKHDLFFALVDYRFQRDTAPLHEEVQQALACEDSLESMKDLLRGVMSRIQQDPDWSRLYLEVMGQSRDPEIRSRVALFHEQALRVSASFVEVFQQSGRYCGDYHARDVAMMWHAIVDGLVMAHLMSPDTVDLEQLSDRLMTMMWHGLAPKTESAKQDNKE